MQEHSCLTMPCFPLNSLLMFSTQKKLEIDSLAVSEPDNRQQISEAAQDGKGKGAKEEKVVMHVCGKHVQSQL